MAEHTYQARREAGPVRYESWDRLLGMGELKLEVLDGQLGLPPEQQEALLGLLLETVGLDRALQLVPLERWRQALAAAERAALPSSTE